MQKKTAVTKFSIYHFNELEISQQQLINKLQKPTHLIPDFMLVLP